MTMLDYLKRLLAGEDLTQEQATAMLDMIFSGEVSEVQVAAFLTAMAAKGQTAVEVGGYAISMRDHTVRVPIDVTPLVDTCGTGGGVHKTCNVSTAAAIVAAGAGVKIAKHGNRGITSGCGSADVLEALGVKLDATPEVIAKCIQEAGVGFMFAPLFHPAMKYVQPVRKALGFRTVFNILGPLTNPARADHQVLGVADAKLMPMMVTALQSLGTKRALVVHSDGLDELSTAGPCLVIELRDGCMEESTLDPADLGLARANVADLQVKDAQDSAASLRAVVGGTERGPKRDIIALNAAAAILVSGGVDNWDAALAAAQTSIDSGQAAHTLELFIKVSNS